ncbi:MAG: carbohydrate kinase [Gammaproteobacteria bacterium]|nr:carbohydrate kinase [Gammaproteobacteria bacterium]
MNTQQDDILIGIDAGTSLIKCVAFSVVGELLAVASTPNEYTTVSDNCAEQDMQLTRSIVLQTLTDLVSKLGSEAKRVKAVSLTGQGDGMWLINRAGEPVQKAWLWLDSRAASLVTELENSADYARLFELTGTAINASQNRIQMLWLERTDPQTLDLADCSFHCKDYLYFCLTGVRATDPGEALFTYGDIKKHQYSPEVLSILGLSHRADTLPDIVDGLTTSSPMLKDICEQVGLPSDTQVNLAAVDVICSALGGGLYDQGTQTAMTLLGTTGIHMRYSSASSELTLPKDKTGYTIVFPGGGHAQLQTNMSATMNIDWLLDLIADAVSLTGNTIDREALLMQLDQYVQETPLGNAIYQPYISTAGERGPFFDANARAGFIGLDQHTDIKDLARCVYEGICLAARDCYDDLGELPTEIRLSGGGAKSSALRHILASVMNRPVRSIDREESGAAGAAMMAAVQLGHYDSIDSCVQTWVAPHLGTAIEPNTDHTDAYNELFTIYKAHRKSQTSTWESLANLRQSSSCISKTAEQGDSH